MPNYPMSGKPIKGNHKARRKLVRAARRKNVQSRALAVVLPFPVPQNLVQVCANALKDPKADIVKMREVVSLVERIEARQAEERFAVAMAQVQAKVPRVVTDKSNSSTNSRYASLEAVSKAVDPIAEEHGFSQSFGTADSPLPGHYRVTCKVSLGMHTRHEFTDVPCDDIGMKGNPTKTKTHGMASALSYGRRILKTMIWNITIADHDDDGQAAGGQTKIDAEQFQRLEAKIDSYGADRMAFKKFFKIDKLPDLPSASFDQAMDMLDRKYKKAAS